MEYFKLNTGDLIPVIANGPGSVGYTGKYKSQDNTIFEAFYHKAVNKFVKRPLARRNYVKSVVNSFKLGYNLLDYSASYGDGSLIGTAIKKSHVNRRNLFITSRVSNKAQVEGKIRECVLRQIENMGVGYLDLLMFHWPVTDCYLRTWREMVNLAKEGLCKNIGVANCYEHHLESIINECGVIPAVNQVEVHPLFTQVPLREYCKSKGILVESYTALARMDDRLYRLPKLHSIALKYKKNLPQIVLRWHIQNGLLPCVRSLNKYRQKENMNIFDFNLTPQEMNTIDGFNINARLRYDSENCDFSIL